MFDEINDFNFERNSIVNQLNNLFAELMDTKDESKRKSIINQYNELIGKLKRLV